MLPTAPQAAPPLDHDDLLSETLLRLPAHPATFLRASLVCRRWHGLLRDPAFLRRVRAFHRTPPVLGLYRVSSRGTCALVPVGDALDRVPAARFDLRDPDDWILLGCRHGRALLRSRPGWLQLLVWDPLTGHRHSIRLGRIGVSGQTKACHATVLGDRGGLGRREGSFRVAFVFTAGGHASACVYSSETCAWGRLITAEARCGHVDIRPSALVGDVLYCVLDRNGILELHLGKESLAVVEPPPRTQSLYQNNFHLTEATGGVLGLAGVKETSLHLWARQIDCNGSAKWVLRKIIELDGLAPTLSARPRFTPKPAHQIVGVDESGNLAFIWTMHGIYMVSLDAAVFKKVSDAKPMEVVRPYSSFYVAGGVGGDEGDFGNSGT